MKGKRGNPPLTEITLDPPPLPMCAGGFVLIYFCSGFPVEGCVLGKMGVGGGIKNNQLAVLGRGWSVTPKLGWHVYTSFYNARRNHHLAVVGSE